jgi:hypothetical protein
MSTYSRTGYKWSVNEILSLQREFELLGWSVEQIAEKHKRTPNAIMFKLDNEGFADYNVLYSNYHGLNSTLPVTRKPNTTLNLLSECDDTSSEQSEDDNADEEYFDDGADEEDEDEDDYDDGEDDVANLSERVDGLEEGISEIRNMINKMMSLFTTKPDCSGVSL